jgi:steroid 5-alpha reductase family enzyme
MSAPQGPVPRIAHVLGYAGLIPFVGLAVLALIDSPPEQALAAFALRAYAVTIVSFLGAIHWGLAMRQAQADTLLLVWGVAPSLLAWASLLIVPGAGSLLLAATLWLCFLVDRRVYPRFGLQAWLRMRLVLTTVASAACVISSGLI